MAPKNPRSSVLLSVSKAREAAQNFFVAAHEAVAQFQERYDDINEGRLSFRIGLGGVGIASTEKLDGAEAKLAEICVKLLTKKVAHEYDIVSAAWSTFDQFKARTDDETASEFATSLLRRLETEASSVPVHYMPNYGVHLSNDVRSLDLGPVRLCKTQDILQEAKNPDWRVAPDKDGFAFCIPHKHISDMLIGKPSDTIPAETILAPEGIVRLTYEQDEATRKITGAFLNLKFPPSCWRVNVNALSQNVHEEALWLVNIAMSLIRLYYPRLEDGGLPGGFGARDCDPVLEIKPQQPTITTDKGLIKAAGSSSGLHYSLTEAQAKHFKTVQFKKLTADLYDAEPKTIAERLAQGLGWLSRGRQADSRTERFLFFFTALEALLSSDDKNAPVTQTIARHAAVIMSDDAAQRAALARELQGLYTLRSELVHSGKRNVSSHEAARSQQLVETLYRSVLDKVDITQKYETLQMALADASYGLPWRPKPS